eukprot:scaffold88_cov387-Prasinococcus_capsulatus_cf.AAC.10
MHALKVPVGLVDGRAAAGLHSTVGGAARHPQSPCAAAVVPGSLCEPTLAWPRAICRCVAPAGCPDSHTDASTSIGCANSSRRVGRLILMTDG